MRAASPSIVLATNDREICLLEADIGGRLGCAWPEMDHARTARNTLITDLIVRE